MTFRGMHGITLSANEIAKDAPAGTVVGTVLIHGQVPRHRLRCSNLKFRFVGNVLVRSSRGTLVEGRDELFEIWIDSVVGA